MQRSTSAGKPLETHGNASAAPCVHLRNGGTSVVVDTTTAGVPTVVWWGADLGPIGDDVLAGIAIGARPQRVSGGVDLPARLNLFPQQSTGWAGTPALTGSRAGRDAYSFLEMTSVEVTGTQLGGTALTVRAVDGRSRLSVEIALAVDAHGLVHQTLTLTNTAEDGAPYELVELAASLPVPYTSTEILDATGRHLRERTPQRHALTVGRYDRESRRGRPGADATLLLTAGTPGFGFEAGSGTAHAVHLAWSGDHRLSVERTPTGDTHLRAAELLGTGEVRLGPGESYTTPPIIASWGDGLTALSARFHDMLRARPHHPATPRPVTLNTWEAVYFDHDLARLQALADAGARVGVERFVLDDGWFRGRRSDDAGLGDWYVDAEVWPEGLHPLIEHVTDLGMQFGIWVEPEMVNPDSDLARKHPEWLLGAAGRVPVVARQQQVLDLSNDAAFAYILERLDALLTANDIAYLKWDHNRDLLEPRSEATDRPAVHANVLAVYRLFDELKTRHPGLEIESCASGGARVDLGVLEHTDRIWASDCIDPIERLTIQKHTGLLVPYELMGAHVSGPESHSTGRRHGLALRAGVALPGHFGIEWDISALSDAELAELATWVAAHKRLRDLAHTGRAVYADLADDSADLRGVVARDGSSAFFTYTQVTSSASYPPAPMTFPGLDDDRRYRVALGEPIATLTGPGQSPLPWTQEPVTLTGRALRTAGLRAPVLFPEHLSLITITAVD